MDKRYFFELSDFVLGQLKPEEFLLLDLSAEESRFCRFNEGRIRQDGIVSDVVLHATLITSSGSELRKLRVSTSLSKNFDRDCQKMGTMLRGLRRELSQLPHDPYARIPNFDHKSEYIGVGELLPLEKVADSIFSPANNFSPTGIYSSGHIVRGQANSAGARHWFSTPSWILDYSLYGTEERAWKGFSAGKSWDQEKWNQEMDRAQTQLDVLECPRRRLPPGEYRVYLAPDAAVDLVWFLGNVFSEADLRRGSSPLCLVKSGQAHFSPNLSFSEDFSSGDTPRFTSEGELAPKSTPLVTAGEVLGTLVGPRSAQEYGIPSNGANASERVRTALLSVGRKTFKEAEALQQLGTGLYVSNLHYLNWSDRPKGRITGMTRYACFWVENGQLQAPIENLRWDDTLFRLFGSEMEGTTDTVHNFPHSYTYGMRSTGSNRCPGILLRSMNFTL